MPDSDCGVGSIVCSGTMDSFDLKSDFCRMTSFQSAISYSQVGLNRLLCVSLIFHSPQAAPKNKGRLRALCDSTPARKLAAPLSGGRRRRRAARSVSHDIEVLDALGEVL